MTSAFLLPLLALSASASPFLPRQNAVNTTSTPSPNSTSNSSSSSSSPNLSNSTSSIIIPSPNITSSTIKAGIAWPNSDWIKMDIFGGGNISWYYTWSPEFAEQSKALDIDYVPQLWGPGQSDDFVSAAEGGWSSTTLTPLKEILAFNEPNLAGQALMTPQEGAALWIRDLEPLRAKGYRLGAPATTNAPDGAVWMKDFLTACNGSCTPDFYPLHWYSTSAQGFEDYVTQWHDTFLAPVWITEFAFHDFNGGSQLNAQEISTALAQCQAFLQSADFVERYSFFGAMMNVQGINPLNALLQNTSDTISLSTLGVQYVTGQLAGDFSESPGITSSAPENSSTTGAASRRIVNAGGWVALGAAVVGTALAGW